jgi:hypothetical protein
LHLLLGRKDLFELSYEKPIAEDTTKKLEALFVLVILELLHPVINSLEYEFKLLDSFIDTLSLSLLDLIKS